MQAVVSRWPSEAELLRQRWFRGGPRSALSWVFQTCNLGIYVPVTLPERDYVRFF